jgi:5'-deoxynucleotidase YfbR-like HD superfamily hydrolase
MGPPKTAREYAQYDPHPIPDDPVAEKLSHDIVEAVLRDLIDQGRLTDAGDDKMKERLAEVVGEKLNDHWNH